LQHDTAHVVYTGKFTDGTVFDTNVGGADLIFEVKEGELISGI
jgi:FKBP-type peptidyl-prolyl cis-trans isomerase